ncbi:MAG: protein kinase C inhibitor [uncultured bacterium]|nr:MAG: protein kinase C inhibitor [uncultured bacterium]
MIKKARFLAKEAQLRVKYIMEKDCIFCKLINGQMKANFVVETEKVVAFADINPVSDVHILIVPKKHIESVLTISREDAGDLVEMHEVAKKLVSDNKLEAFRLAYNGGRFQHVGHLHMHLLAGRSIQWSKL